MKLSRAVRAVGTTFRRRAVDLLPFYVLGASVPAVARVVVFLAAFVGYLWLQSTGRLEAFYDGIREAGLEMPEFESEEAMVEWMDAIGAILADTLTSTDAAVLGGLFVLASFVFLVLFVLLSALASAGQLAACIACLRGERGLVPGVAGVRNYWLSFLGLFVLEFLVWALVTVGVALIGGVLWLGAGGESALEVLIVVVGVLVWLLAVLVIRALFTFAPAAIVVDEVGPITALRNGIGFLRRRPVEAVFYYVVSIGVAVGFTSVLSVLFIVDVVTIVPLVTALVLTPVLDLLKTTLYGGYRDAIAPPGPAGRRLRTQLRSGVGRGVGELATFVRSTPLLHGFTVAIGLVGFWMGWVAAEPLADIVEVSIRSRVQGLIPPAFALELFGNNWLVALTTAFSGLALAIPAVVAIWFNGVNIGMLSQLEADPDVLLAFVVPHGIIEVPAIIVAGALGIHLGLVWWRSVRGRLSRVELADELERAVWVLIGIGLLLAIAAVIEAFVSPYYWRPFL
ncbi:stage II sporulation protein M [Natronobiforma cellulositropha]|uniref:stage II sporulation protein M n=1 Tax=Natronobiforma cellulositropha TaxID=1679076 RepID=UPI0021D6100C|nr:stage II sporulation protein M [Natronobiforma cellulositropha]